MRGGWRVSARGVYYCKQIAAYAIGIEDDLNLAIFFINRRSSEQCLTIIQAKCLLTDNIIKMKYLWNGIVFCQAQSQLQLNLVGLSLALFSVYPATRLANRPSRMLNSWKLTVYRHYEIKQSIQMEENLNGRRQHHWKMKSLKDNINGRFPQWKMTSMEDDLNVRRSW